MMKDFYQNLLPEWIDINLLITWGPIIKTLLSFFVIFWSNRKSLFRYESLILIPKTIFYPLKEAFPDLLLFFKIHHHEGFKIIQSFFPSIICIIIASCIKVPIGRFLDIELIYFFLLSHCFQGSVSLDGNG